MQNNTKPTATAVPCRALVAILGNALELKHILSSGEFHEHLDDLLESFMLSEIANDIVERDKALTVHNTLKDLIDALESLTEGEYIGINRYLLEVCEDQMKESGHGE